MRGKVFKDSLGVHEDQARVLFDYFHQAAQKIVAEEMVLEKKAAVERADAQQLVGERKKHLYISIGIGLAGLALCFLFWQAGGPLVLGAGLFYWLSARSDKAKQEASDNRVHEFKKAHSRIKRDYQVHKLGVAYVPIATAVPFEEKSFLVDHTGMESPSLFKLRAVRKPEELNKSVNQILSSLEKVPCVDKGEDAEQIPVGEYSTSIQDLTYLDYMGTLDREMRSAAFHMSDTDEINVVMPVIDPRGPVSRFIQEHCALETGGAPVVEVFDIEACREDLDRFRELNELRSGLGEQAAQFDQFLQGLMVRMAESVQLLTVLKMRSCDRLAEISSRTLVNTLKASHNHYSPLLEAEEIARIKLEKFDYQDAVEHYTPFNLKKSSQVKYDLFSQNWIAEDGSRTSFPFGMHQIYEEVVMPVVKNLMEETRKDRLLIYNQIKDQKINYLNQWHQDTDDFYGRNRSESNDLINRMRNTFANYTAALNTLKALEATENEMAATGSLDSTTVDSKSNMGESLVAFEAQGAQFQAQQQEFSDYMDRLKEDIDRRAETFSHIEYFDASLRDGLSKLSAVAGDNLQDLDPRRRGLAEVSPYFAQAADLPPAPRMEAAAQEDFSLNLKVVVAAALQDLREQEGQDAPSPPETPEPGVPAEAAGEESAPPAPELEREDPEPVEEPDSAPEEEGPDSRAGEESDPSEDDRL